MPHASSAQDQDPPGHAAAVNDCRDETLIHAAGRGDSPRKQWTVMAPDHNPTLPASGRHSARKNAARELAARTGMKYTAALRLLGRDTQREPVHRWILTDDVRAWFAGKGWRNAYYGDLYDWLDALTPSYECDWCSEPGDARETDSSIKLVIAAYDPDLSPITGHLFTYKYHATCQPSTITFAHQIDIAPLPQRIELPASAQPDITGEFELDARPILVNDLAEEPPHAVLLITAQVVDDQGEGAAPWLNELHLNLSSQGLGHPELELDDDDAGWSVRIATDYPSARDSEWLAIRTPHSTPANPHHLLLAVMDLPPDWVAAARSTGQVTVVLGPCSIHWDEPQISIWPGGDLQDQVLEGECCCEQVTADDIDDLVNSHAFLTSTLRVASLDD